MEDFIDLCKQDFSFFGKGGEISGNFKLQGPTRISSKIQGKITIKDGAKLYIDKDGEVKGEINCHNLEIHGRFEGTIISTGHVAVFPPGNISGKISTTNLIIHPGAVVNIEGNTIN